MGRIKNTGICHGTIGSPQTSFEQDVYEEVIKSLVSVGLSAGDAHYMKENDRFLINIAKRSDVDPNGYFDVILHGESKSVSIVVGDKRIKVKGKSLARIIKSNSQYKGQKIRLLSCNTGELSRGVAQSLSDHLKVEVVAPTKVLWATPSGHYFVAGGDAQNIRPNYKDIGSFKTFYPGGGKQ